jgi:hypothetical protein
MVSVLTAVEFLGYQLAGQMRDTIVVYVDFARD